jgi:hypothetical protein
MPEHREDNKIKRSTFILGFFKVVLLILLVSSFLHLIVFFSQFSPYFTRTWVNFRIIRVFKAVQLQLHH